MDSRFTIFVTTILITLVQLVSGQDQSDINSDISDVLNNIETFAEGPVGISIGTLLVVLLIFLLSLCCMCWVYYAKELCCRNGAGCFQNCCECCCIRCRKQSKEIENKDGETEPFIPKPPQTPSPPTSIDGVNAVNNQTRISTTTFSLVD